MKIGIAGYKGRMGQMLVRELESGAWPGLTYAGGTLSSDNPEILFDADASATTTIFDTNSCTHPFSVVKRSFQASKR